MNYKSSQNLFQMNGYCANSTLFCKKIIISDNKLFAATSNLEYKDIPKLSELKNAQKLGNKLTNYKF